MANVPKTGKVMGILTIIFTSLALLGALISLAGANLANAVAQMGQSHAEMGTRQLESFFSATLTISSITTALQAGTAALGLAAGIGLVSGRRWSIVGANIYAVGTIVLAIGGYFVSLAVANQAMDAMMAEMGSMSGSFDAFGRQFVGAIGGTFGLVGVVFASAYPIVLMALINRKSVRDAYME